MTGQFEFRDREHLVEEIVATKRQAHSRARENRDERRRRRRAGQRVFARQALANATGTVIGGAFLALGASAIGIIDALPPTAVIVLIGLAGLPFVVASDRARQTDEFDEETARREAETTIEEWIRLGFLRPDAARQSRDNEGGSGAVESG